MSQAALLLLVRWLFALVAVVAIVAFVVRPLLRLLRQKPDVDLMTPDYGSMLDGEELEIPTEKEAGDFDRNAAIAAARADPQATALAVQRWLKQRK
jgi:flagellar biosynthesis/type III secretory pathway M-ring protein FliF/YscJ